MSGAPFSGVLIGGGSAGARGESATDSYRPSHGSRAERAEAAAATGRQPWLARAKLQAPPQNVPVLDRPRLLEQLDGLLDCGLGLLVAPAGFGKTTVLARWRARLLERGCRVGWLTLDDNDAEPRTFLCGLILAAARGGVPVGPLLRLAERDLAGLSVRAGASALLEAIWRDPAPVVLLLDDYHRLGISAVDELLGEMLAAGPANWHVVIASRFTPDLNVPRLLAAGQAREIDVESLRFTREESCRVLADLPEAVAERLFSRTEGWPVAVQLARLVVRDSMADPTALLERFTGCNGHMAGFLADQVLAGLPPPALELLICTSILERFNISLANEVCGRTDSLQLLDRLESLRALVIPLGAGREWFRCHPLLAEYLLSLLRRRPAHEEQRLHLAASGWFEQHGELCEAVFHARRAGAELWCARLVEAAGGWELMLRDGGADQLRRLLHDLPDSTLTAHPRLRLARVCLLIKDGCLEDARACYDAALARGAGLDPMLARDLSNVGRLLQRYEDQPATAADLVALSADEQTVPRQDGATHATLRLAQSLTALAIGDLPRAEESGRTAIAGLPPAGSTLGLSYGGLHAGLAAFYQGQFRRAQAHYDKVHGLLVDSRATSHERAPVEILNGALLYWRGEADAGTSQALRTAAQHAGEHDGWLELYACALDTWVEMALASDPPQRATEVANWASELAARRGLARLRDLADAMRLRITLCSAAQPAVNGVAYRLAEAYPLGCWRRASRCWLPYLTLALAGRPDRVDPQTGARLDDAIDCARTLRAVLYLIRLLLRRALLAAHAGRRHAALTDLLEAARWAAPEWIRGPFHGNPALLPLLRAAQRKIRAEAPGTLLQRFVADGLPACEAVGEDAALLSPREREVLQELALGLSNKQIAQALGMTEHTVKFHLKNIFAKLGVDRRNLAVEQVRNRPGILG